MPYASLSNAKGEHGEAGPRAPRVNEGTCGQSLYWAPFRNHPKGWFFVLFVVFGWERLEGLESFFFLINFVYEQNLSKMVCAA